MQLPSFKFDLLWDEEKLRSLHKRLLIILVPGTFVFAPTYAYLLPDSNPYRLFIGLSPVIFGAPVFVYNFLTLKKQNQGIRFLATNLALVLITVLFMSVTGGFRSPAQFAPILVLFMSGIFIGATAAGIVFGFTIILYSGMYFWLKLSSTDPNLAADFFIFLAPFMLIGLVQRTIGRELSLQFEAKKKLEQVDDLKNQFITLASHYLRTPLTIINGLMSELNLKITDAESKDKIEKIKANVNKLDGLIERLLTISEIEKGKARVMELNEDIAKIIDYAISKCRPMANQQKVNLVYLAPSMPVERFPFDRIKIESVMLALIDNAIKYNKAGGSVKVILQNGPGQVRIDVSDTGVGISKEHLDTLFSTFNRGTIEDTLSFDNPGMGLSLYLAKLIVEAHGGEIFVESKEGQGSNFTVMLPKGS